MPLHKRDGNDAAKQQGLKAAVVAVGDVGLKSALFAVGDALRINSFPRKDSTEEDTKEEGKMRLTNNFRFHSFEGSSDHRNKERSDDDNISGYSTACRSALSKESDDGGDFYVDFPTNREEMLDARRDTEEEVNGDNSDNSAARKLEQAIEVEIDQRKPWRRIDSSGEIPQNVENNITKSSHDVSETDNINKGYDNIGFAFEDESGYEVHCDASDMTEYTDASVISELRSAQKALGWKYDDTRSVCSSVRSGVSQGKGNFRLERDNGCSRRSLIEFNELPTIQDEDGRKELRRSPSDLSNVTPKRTSNRSVLSNVVNVDPSSGEIREETPRVSNYQMN